MKNNSIPISFSFPFRNYFVRWVFLKLGEPKTKFSTIRNAHFHSQQIRIGKWSLGHMEELYWKYVQ